MALQVWLPLNKNGADKNQGLANISVDNNAVYSDSGKLGGCYFYKDGLCQSFNNNLTSIIGEKRSICVWVKPAGNHIHYTGAIVSSGNWNSSNWTFGINSNNTGVTGFGSGYSTYLSCNVPVNEWTHLTCVTNGTHHDIYKNGSYIGSLTSGDSLLYSDASNTTIGRETYAGGYFGFNGYINDVRIYDHCLSPKEVKEIAKGLVLHYPLNDAYVEGTVNLGNTSASYSNMTEGREYTATSWGGDAGTVTYYKSGGYNNLPYKVYHKTASGSGGIYYKTANDISIVAGKTYTMSIWVKASRNFLGSIFSFNINGVTSSDSNHYITYPKNFQFTTEWTRISRTFTATESDAGMYGEMSIIYDDGDTDYYVYFSGFQIEEKDHATPYTPNTRNESTVYDCSGYQNNGTVKEFKAAGNNLVTGLTAGGQTTVSGETITTSGVNADTYFSINLSESIVVGQTYTLSCVGKNIPTDGYFGFPLGWQGNTSLMFKIKNGYNEIIFTANDGSWGTNRLFMDDMGRDTAYMNQCEFTSFKLYKHSTVNGGLNVVFDSPRYKTCVQTSSSGKIQKDAFLPSAITHYTISVWCKITDPNAAAHLWTKHSNGSKGIIQGPDGGWIYSYNGGGLITRTSFLTTSGTITQTYPGFGQNYKDGNWHMYTIVGNGNINTCYLDGVMTGRSTISDFVSYNINGQLNIGLTEECLVSDYRVYATALSEEDIKELYNTSAYVLDNGTLLTYNLEE